MDAIPVGEDDLASEGLHPAVAREVLPRAALPFASVGRSDDVLDLLTSAILPGGVDPGSFVGLKGRLGRLASADDGEGGNGPDMHPEIVCR